MIDVILIETDSKSNIHWNEDNHFFITKTKKFIGTNYEFVLIDTDSKISKGNWYCDIENCVVLESDTDIVSDSCFKVISTSSKDINLPHISKDFQSDLITYFNKMGLSTYELSGQGVLLTNQFTKFRNSSVLSTEHNFDVLDVIETIKQYDSTATLEEKGKYFDVIQKTLRNYGGALYCEEEVLELIRKYNSRHDTIQDERRRNIVTSEWFETNKK